MGYKDFMWKTKKKKGTWRKFLIVMPPQQKTETPRSCFDEQTLISFFTCGWNATLLAATTTSKIKTVIPWAQPRRSRKLPYEL